MQNWSHHDGNQHTPPTCRPPAREPYDRISHGRLWSLNLALFRHRTTAVFPEGRRENSPGQAECRPGTASRARIRAPSGRGEYSNHSSQLSCECPPHQKDQQYPAICRWRDRAASVDLAIAGLPAAQLPPTALETPLPANAVPPPECSPQRAQPTTFPESAASHATAAEAMPALLAVAWRRASSPLAPAHRVPADSALGAPTE